MTAKTSTVLVIGAAGNFGASWPDVINSGVFAEPWSTQTRFSRVDYRDVSEVAAIALNDERLNFESLTKHRRDYANPT